MARGFMNLQPINPCIQMGNQHFPLQCLQRAVGLGNLTKDLSAARPKLGGIHQVSDSHVMAYDFCHGIMFQKGAQAPGMIKMNVGEENGIHPFQAHGFKALYEAIDGVGRSHIDQDILPSKTDPGTNEMIKSGHIRHKLYEYWIHNQANIAKIMDMSQETRTYQITQICACL